MADNLKSNVKSGIDDAANGAKNLADRGINAVNRATSGNSATGPGATGGSTMDAARDTLHNVVEKAGAYTHDAKEKVGEWADQVGDKAQKWAGDAYEVATDKAGDFGREVTELVRRHPLPAIMIGFGVGLLLGRAARIV